MHIRTGEKELDVNGDKMDKKKKRKPKAIVLDMDDTIVNFMGFLCSFYNSKNGTSITEHDLISWNFKDVEVKDARGNVVKGAALRELFQNLEGQGLYAALPVIKESRQAIEVASKMGYKIIILTARNEKYRVQTELNIVRNNIICDKLIHDWDKVKTINNLKKEYNILLFADDKLETVKLVSEQCDLEYTFLIEKAHNRDIEVKEEDEYLKIRDLFEVIRYLK